MLHALLVAVCVAALSYLTTTTTAFLVVPSADRLLLDHPRLLVGRNAAVTLFASSPPDPTAVVTNTDQEKDDKATVVEIPTKSGGLVTLIGTAHLSKQSNAQVTRIIGTIQPDVIAVELDEKRLERIGFKSIADLGMDQVVTAADILISNNNENNKNWMTLPTEWFLNVMSSVARKLLTGMYDDMSNQIDSEAGGEFLAAINAAKAIKNDNTTTVPKLVLADRESTETIRRAMELAFQHGNPLQVLNRLNQVNAQELSRLQEQVEKDTGKTRNDDQFPVLMMEAMKADTGFRTRLFERLEQEVPAFTEAFLKERDYIMATAIQREINAGAQRIVGVVGLAHVPGMKTILLENNNKS